MSFVTMRVPGTRLSCFRLPWRRRWWNFWHWSSWSSTTRNYLGATESDLSEFYSPRIGSSSGGMKLQMVYFETHILPALFDTRTVRIGRRIFVYVRKYMRHLAMSRNLTKTPTWDSIFFDAGNSWRGWLVVFRVISLFWNCTIYHRWMGLLKCGVVWFAEKLRVATITPSDSFFRI